MILELTQDTDLIKTVMLDPEMWELIQDDSVEKSDFMAIVPANMLVLSAIVGNVIGLHLFVEKEEGVIYHPMLLKPFRKEFGREFMRKGLDWIFENTATEQLFAEIPTDHISTINLAKHLNFKEIGIKKNGRKQGGKMLDLQRLRLNKGDLWAA